MQAVFATHEFLPILEVTPQLGRSFATGDDDPDGEHTVMVSDGYWRSRFGGSRAVVGRRINIEGNQTSIIGVLPPWFEFIDQKVDLLFTVSGNHRVAPYAPTSSVGQLGQLHDALAVAYAQAGQFADPNASISAAALVKRAEAHVR